MSETKYLLSVTSLHVNYGAIKAVKDVTIHVPEGKIVTLIGANGAGKTTTLNAISGRVKTASGAITYNGKNITNIRTDYINRMGIALCPEGRKIFANLTVKENLLMGAYKRKDKIEIEKDLDYVFSLFPRLKERISQAGGTLSGGEQQMLAIGRALMSKPKLMMMDEPSLGLAPIVVSEMFGIIKKLNQSGVTILLIEQNAATALKTADYAYVLETGHIKLQGESSDLLKNDEVKKLYLGM